MRHHVSSVLIDLDVAAGRATASSYFFVVTEVGPDHWGTYREELRFDSAFMFAYSEREGTAAEWLRYDLETLLDPYRRSGKTAGRRRRVTGARDKRGR